MTRGRLVAGALGGLMLVAEGAMHSLLGWPEARRTLLGATTQPELVKGLVVPWHLAGLGMAALGLLALVACVRMLRGAREAGWVTGIVGGAFLVFGLAGLVLVRADATFALFVVPGILCLVAAGGRSSSERAEARG